MKYNLYISTSLLHYNIFEINNEKLQIIVSAYINGKSSFTISGKLYYLSDLSEFKIFTIEDKNENNHTRAINFYLGNINFHKRFGSAHYLPPKTLQLMGKDVTEQFIGDKEFGSDLKKTETVTVIAVKKEFVNETRIQELKDIKSEKFDFTKLIQFCKEINDNYSRENFLSVAMLSRSILNHIPPIFNFKTFNEVCAQHGGQSFKKNMENLNKSMKNIADGHLHETIKKSEVLPNSTQINFSQDLDVLLAEVVRISKT